MVRRQRLIQDSVRSATHLRGGAVKPIWPARLRTISTLILCMLAAQSTS